MSMMDHLPALQVVLPLLSAPFCILMRQHMLAWAVALVASAAAFAVALMCWGVVANGATLTYNMGGWQPPFGIALEIDAFSVLLTTIISGASLLALIAGVPSIRQQIPDEKQPLFFSAWLLALAGLLGITVTADAFNVFVFMEISSLASYVIIAAGPHRKALGAVFKYLAMGTIGATFYLIGVGLIYLMTGTLNLEDMALRLNDVADQRPILVAAGFITIGLALKAAVFPLHVWMPNAYNYAPHVVSVFIAACATKVSLYVLFRFDFIVFQSNLIGHEFKFSYFLMPLSLIAIVFGALVAALSKDLKRLLAWSSVSQIGYIVLGASMTTEAGLTSAIAHMFNHAIAKGGGFLIAMGAALYYTTTRFTNLAGLGKEHPWMAAAFVVIGCSLIGVPGTAGFISKWLLVSAALELEALGVVIIAVVVLSSLLAVVYVWKVVELFYFESRPEGGSSEVMSVGLMEKAMLMGVLYIVAFANVWFGLAPSEPLAMASKAAALLTGGAL
jgi:multicomponent Na+:H+ antiporter subunit D